MTLNEEFSTRIYHTFWVIASRNYPEKIVTNAEGVQIYLDPAEAKRECDSKNAEIKDRWPGPVGSYSKDAYRVLRCEAVTVEETEFSIYGDVAQLDRASAS